MSQQTSEVLLGDSKARHEQFFFNLQYFQQKRITFESSESLA